MITAHRCMIAQQHPQFRAVRTLIPGHLSAAQPLLHSVVAEETCCRYRAQIGVVDQDPRLFAESISANICYNCPGTASQVPR